MKKVILSGIVFLITFTISVFSQNPEDLLPAENEIPGWVFETDSICNEGTANDAQGLYGIIDGGADVYLNRGFLAGAFDGYTDGSYPLCVEIYDQGFKDSAVSVYKETYDGEYKLITTAGDSARLDTVSMFNFEIEMIVDKYFVRIFTIDTKEEAYIQAGINMAQNIAGEVGIIDKPVFQNTLSTDNISINYAKNSYSFTIHGKNRIREASIYSNKGRLIRNIPTQSTKKGFKAVWDGKNKAGLKVAKGHYSIIIRRDEGFISKSFIINK